MSISVGILQDSSELSGIIEDSCCDYETVNSINAAVLNPILQQLVTTSFFRYFKVFFQLCLLQLHEFICVEFSVMCVSFELISNSYK